MAAEPTMAMVLEGGRTTMPFRQAGKRANANAKRDTTRTRFVTTSLLGCTGTLAGMVFSIAQAPKRTQPTAAPLQHTA